MLIFLSRFSKMFIILEYHGKNFHPPPIEYPTSWPQWPSPWLSSSSQISPWPQESFGSLSPGKYPMQIQSYEHQQQPQLFSNAPLSYPPPWSQPHLQLYPSLSPYLTPYPNPYPTYYPYPYPSMHSNPNPYSSPTPNPNTYPNTSPYPNPYPRCNPSPKSNPNPNPNLSTNINQNHIPNHIVNPNLNHRVSKQFEPPILPVDSHIKQNTTSSMLGKKMNLETCPITTENSPREDIIQRPLEDQYFIGTCSKIVVETQNPRIPLKYSCQSENQIFETEIEGFMFCLSPDPLCLHRSDYQTVEDFHQLENHKYVDLIES